MTANDPKHSKQPQPYSASSVMQRYQHIMDAPDELPEGGCCTLEDKAQHIMAEKNGEPVPEEMVEVCPPGRCATCCLGLANAVKKVVEAKREEAQDATPEVDAEK